MDVVAARILTVHAGKIATLAYKGGTKASAILKPAVPGPVRVGPLGIDGDEQADTKHHGGKTQALCCYPREHYPYWQQRLKKELPEAAFGENFVTEGVTEETVCIGDVFRVGSCVVQITQPRGPCATLAAFLQEPMMAAWAQENGYTGWYMSVLQYGSVEAGDAMVLEGKPGSGVTVMDVNRAMWLRGKDPALTERVLAEDLLLGKWRAKLRKFAEIRPPGASV